MSKRLIIFASIFLALCILAIPRNQANAQDYALSMAVSCPEKAYVGESFFCQVTIQNSENASHDYTLVWYVDDPAHTTPQFNTSGTIGPNGTVKTGSSFMFSEAENPGLSYYFTYNDHRISVKLLQDGWQAVNLLDVDVDVVKVDLSLISTITPEPVQPNSTFSLGLMLWNEGGEPLNATVRVYEVRGAITLQSGVFADYGQIAANSFATKTFNFEVDTSVTPADYPIKVWVQYTDTRGYTYSRNYYVTISVTSLGVELRPFESTMNEAIDGLRSDLNLTSSNFTLISVALLAVSVILALANYGYSRRIARVRRKPTATA